MLVFVLLVVWFGDTGVYFAGKTLGIIGCGEIGRMTARKAEVFGLKLIGCDPYVEKSVTDGYHITLMSREEVLKQSDYVALHTPLTDATRHILDAAALAQTRNGVRIDGADIYVTASPCFGCFKLIANSGLSRIVFGEFYRDERIFKLSEQLKIELLHLPADKLTRTATP